MRIPATVGALLVALALAGCSSQEPRSVVDPEEAEPKDYVQGSIVVGVLAVAIAILVGVLLMVRRRRRDRTAAAGALAAPGRKVP